MQFFRVGGYVRDSLLGLAPKDCDWLVVGATPQQMLDQGFRQVGQDFPVFLHPDTREEYALARTERKSGVGYTGFSFEADPSVTLEQDLYRRDLSINAMAMDEAGNIFDPYGGRRDLQNKVLRHVSPAFVEDPLRVLRVARFYARLAPLGFTLHEDTVKLMAQIADSGELDALTPERVWLELNKALAEQKPSGFFIALQHCQALAKLFPELDRLRGVPQRKEYHPEIDTFDHVMRVVDRAAQLSDDVAVIFAALVHDLGKGDTPRQYWPRHHGHEKASVKRVDELCSRIRVPKNIKQLAVLVAAEHGNMHRASELKASTVLSLFEKLDYFRNPHRLQAFLLACQADSQGRLGFEEREYLPAQYLRQCAKALDNINVRELITAQMSGEQIRAALQRQRQQMIARVKQQFYDLAGPEQDE